MKTYSLIYSEGFPFLRQDNPLRDSQHLVSRDAYNSHEALYIDSALLLINPIHNKRSYTEAELLIQWQFLEEDVWIDVSEPNFIGTGSADYRMVFKAKQIAVSYQDRVANWAEDCFGAEDAGNVPERVWRFLEEAAELAQSLGMSRDEAYRQITHTFNRPPGEPAQEVGGVMVTLATLCAAADINMLESAEKEYDRVLVNIEPIREKQKFKNQQKITAV